jgi:hypothetical protein
MNQETNNAIEELTEEFSGEEPYYFSPSITKRRTINGKDYIIRSYFKGGKDFQKTVQGLAVKQAYKKVR